MLGNWIGRQAKGLYLSSRYLISPRANVQFLFRNQVTDPKFIPGGATLDDFRVTAEFPLGQSLNLSSFVQFERWNIPLLASGAQHNVTTSVELKYRPGWRLEGELTEALATRSQCLKVRAYTSNSVVLCFLSVNRQTESSTYRCSFR